jgi:hypothetical protein
MSILPLELAPSELGIFPAFMKMTIGSRKAEEFGFRNRKRKTEGRIYDERAAAV